MRKYNILPVFLLFTVLSFGQIDFKQVVPPNPEVAALFKSVITPVNQYSGLPNVSIPLYTVSEGALSVPISLSYNTGGIQVSEEASSIGLGWALNAGGAITRSVNGEDDFLDGYGYIAANTQAPDFSGFNKDMAPFINANGDCQFMVNGVNQTFDHLTNKPVDFDYIPDTFHYNFNGYSGSFMIQQNLEIFQTEKQDVKIEVYDGTNNNFNLGFATPFFRITVGDGTIYEFTKLGNTSFPNGNLNNYISSWFLTSVTDISGNTINFLYNNDFESTRTSQPFRSFTQSFEVPTDLDPPNTGGNPTGPGDGPMRRYYNNAGPTTVVDDIKIKTIEFDLGTVVFNYSSDSGADARLDNDSNYLKSIEVLNKLSTTAVKSFVLDHSYFGANTTFDYNQVSLQNRDYAQVIGALADGFPHLNLRLKFDGITEDGVKTHRFDYYNSTTVPNKTTLSQDYWGFYNHAPNENIFIPELRDERGRSLDFPEFTNANRLPDQQFAKYFSLRKITYPTGGSTEFDYELNTYMPPENDEVLPLATVPRNIYAEAQPGEEVDELETILFCPNINAALYISMSVQLFGYDTSRDKPNLTASDFLNGFYVELQRRDGTVVRRLSISQSDGETWWNGLDNNPDGSNYDGNDYTNILRFEDSAILTSDNPNAFDRLENDHYILKAVFDSKDQRVYGNAIITAKWQDEQVSSTSLFAVGGGLRTKSTVDRDSDGSIETKRNFNYHYKELLDGIELERSYGKVKTLPNYYADHRTVYKLSYGPAWFEETSLPKIVGNATSHNSFSKDAGSYVGYDQVEVTYESPDGDNGKTIYKFHNQEDFFNISWDVDYRDDYYKFPPLRAPQNGLTYRTEHYKRDGSAYTLVNAIDEEHQVNGLDARYFNIDALISHQDYLQGAVKEKPISLLLEAGASIVICNTLQFQYYPYYSNLTQQTKVSETSYDLDGNNPLTIVQDFAYESNFHFQRTKTTVTESDGTSMETKIYFPDDIASATSLSEGGVLENYDEIALLKSNQLYRPTTPIQTTVLRDGSIVSVQRELFDAFENVILPSKTQTAKGITAMEDRLIYELYDKGKPLQMRKEDGTPISYIWGYNNSYPIAKIENATYDDLAAALPGISSSNQVKNLDESDVSLINGLRTSNPEFMVTTYTYIPLVGMTSFTDPRNYTTTFEYDAQSRLQKVKDGSDHIMMDYDYHYQGQN